jgi:hypothetical protein
MAAHRHIAALPDWFIDAQSMRPDQPVDAASPPKRPMAGLTVIDFPNNHLSYAITWFSLALLPGRHSAGAPPARLRAVRMSRPLTWDIAPPPSAT